MYPFYLVIVTLSIYTIIGLVASIDGEVVKLRLTGHVPVRLAGGTLIGFGSTFALRVILGSAVYVGRWCKEAS